MRIIVTGERRWIDYKLADDLIGRLQTRYGRETVIIHGGFPGIDHCIANACHENNCPSELYLADFTHAGDYEHQNRELLSRGAAMSVILHRGELDAWCKDLARQAIAGGIPTYLIDNKEGKPTRL